MDTTLREMLLCAREEYSEMITKTRGMGFDKALHKLSVGDAHYGLCHYLNINKSITFRDKDYNSYDFMWEEMLRIGRYHEYHIIPRPKDAMDILDIIKALQARVELIEQILA